MVRPIPCFNSRPAIVLATGVVLGLTASGAQAASPSATSPRPCASSSPGVVSTLGAWETDQDSIADPANYGTGDEPFTVTVYGLATGLGRYPVNGGGPKALRAVRRGNRIVRVELCRGPELLAARSVAGSATKIGGVSVNGNRIAWRQWRPNGSGTVSVGRVSGRRIVGVRSVRVPALRSTQAINGRILVMPNGTAAWSFAVAGRAAVWLWPQGRTARRLQLPATARRKTPGWNVRIVDDRHVILGDTDQVVRYGPTTPGRCPTPMGAKTLAIEPDHSVVAVGGAAYFQSTDTNSWSQTLICDSRVGDYVSVRADTGYSDKYGEGSGTDRVAVLATAGVVVHVSVKPTYDRTPSAEIMDLSTATSTSVNGAVDGVATGGTPDASAPRPIGVRVLPGAVAWVAAPRGSGPLSIWLADSRGVRQVGTVPTTTLDPKITLTTEAVTWTDGASEQSAAVLPTAGAAVQRISEGDS